MDNAELLILGVTGFAGGAFGAMLGLGGGILIVPLLTGVLGIPIHEAIGASLVGVVATSSAGAGVYLKARLVNVRLGLLLEPMLALGGITGGLIAALLSGQILSVLFALALIYTAYNMYKSGRGESEQSRRQIDEHVQVAKDSRLHDALSGEIFDRATGGTVAYRVRRVPAGLGASFVAGSLAGLLGIGGGIVKVPVMHLLMGLPLKTSVATSNFAMGITASAAAFVYLSEGLVNPFLVAPVVIGVVAGAQVGSRVSERIQTSVLRRVFVLVLFLMAAQMVLRAFGSTL